MMRSGERATLCKEALLRRMFSEKKSAGRKVLDMATFEKAVVREADNRQASDQMMPPAPRGWRDLVEADLGAKFAGGARGGPTPPPPDLAWGRRHPNRRGRREMAPGAAEIRSAAHRF